MPTDRNLEIAQTYIETGGNVSETARQLGLTRPTVIYHARQAGVYGKAISGGKVKADGRATRDVPSSGVSTYILTSVQNNTKVWQPFYKNLRAYQDFREAELLVSSFTYNQNAYGKLSVKRGTNKDKDSALWYDSEIAGLLDEGDKDIELAPGLVWCGRMNTLPTSSQPLNGLETYTGTASGIFPHAKIAMRSIAQPMDEGAKFNYTTGALTQRNYIQKAAGIKAEHHHVYGAMIIEVMPDGVWYARQLNADSRGRFYDLGYLVEDECVYEADDSVEAITWGDIHEAQLDPRVRELAWAEGGMLDELGPKYQFFHDTLDFYARNHHERGNPHTMFRRYVDGMDSVEGEIASVAKFLTEESAREWCDSVVVDSNHDSALGKWLREADYKNDPVNAVFFLEMQLASYQAIVERSDFHVVEHAMRRAGVPEKVRFLREDESYIICQGIQCGAHGHLGPDGSRGSPINLAKQGRKGNTGHTHSAGIRDGLYTAGLCGKLKQGYNRGPSSWSHSHVVTYRNGKRCIVTMTPEDWRGR